MNVLFLDQFNQLGGAQQCLVDLIDGMACDGLHAALPGTGPLSSALRSRGVHVHELREMTYSNGRKSAADVLRFTSDIFRLSPELRNLIEAHAIDLLYVNGPRMLPAAAMASKPVVFHAHSYLDKRYAAALAKWSLRRSNASVIASSRFVAKALPPDRVRVIYNGVRELPFRLPAPPFRRKWQIGIVGRIAPEKGQVDFVSAARILSAHGLEAEYSIHGAPLFSDSTYMDRVRKLSADLPVVFRGWSDHMPDVYAGLDLLVVPSSWIDATPRVILEAFSAGLPVVAYRSGGIPELIEHGVTGVLTESASSESLAEAIERLVGNPMQMSAIARAARTAWERRFTVQRYVREVLEFVATTPAGSKIPQLSRAAQP